MYPRSFVQYLVYFHCFRDYFECHEVLEEFWKKEGLTKKIWVGFIQLAVAMYHYRRDNIKGAKTQLKKALIIFEHEQKQIDQLGIDYDMLKNRLLHKEKELLIEKPYQPMFIPIKDTDLLHECEQMSITMGTKWGKVEGPISDNIIHKHKQRDRSAIIKEREIQQKKRGRY